MKVLIDPIYSAKPSHCSSALKARRIIEHVLSLRDDVFFRLLVPDDSWELPPEEYEWFPQHPNVQLIKYPYNRDRMMAYQAFPKELENLVAFNGSCWDNDVIITMRTQQVPNMRIVLTSPRHYNQTFLKQILVYEEMPVMSFKKTVAVSDRPVQDMATCLGYVAADDVFITIAHEKEGVLREAKKYFSPAIQRELLKKIKVYTPVNIKSFGFHGKKKAQRFKRGERPFCLGFTERMGTSTTNLDTIYDLIEKTWIMKGDQGFRMVFSTVTTGIKKSPPKFCQILHSKREEFWRLLREEMDLVVTMTTEGGFGMSTVEPLLWGVPSIAKRAEWLEALFGEDYPFFVDTEAQAYALVKAFHDDYDKMYAKFYQWQQTKFKAMFEPGGVFQDNLYDLVMGWLDKRDAVLERFRQQFPRKEHNEIIRLVADTVKGREEFRLRGVLEELADSGQLRSMAGKLDDERGDRGIVWSTPWNEFRVALMAFYGWDDASPEVGHFRRARKGVES